jgi:uncharacterized protein YegL
MLRCLALLLALSTPAFAGGITAAVQVDDPILRPNDPGQVTLSLTGEWLSSRERVDIIVSIDTSGSLDRTEMRSSVAFARGLIDALPAERFADGTLRVALHTFATKAVVRVPATSDLAAVRASLTALESTRGEGSTCHSCAIQSALAASPQAEGAPNVVLVMLTDGNATTGQAATSAQRAAADARGLQRFVVGVGDGVAQSNLIVIASSPPERFVMQVDGFTNLAGAVAPLLAEIKRPGGTGVRVTAVLNDDLVSAVPRPLGSGFFPRTPGLTPSQGQALTDGRTITWYLGDLGADIAQLTFPVAPNCSSRGEPVALFEQVWVSSEEGGTVEVPNPRVKGAGCPDRVMLTPDAQSVRSRDHAPVAVTVLDSEGDPVPFTDLVLEVSEGPSRELSLSTQTGADGTSTFQVPGHFGPGTDVIWARTLFGADVRSELVRVTWTGRPLQPERGTLPTYPPLDLTPVVTPTPDPPPTPEPPPTPTLEPTPTPAPAIPPKPAQSDRPLAFAESVACVQVFADRNECDWGHWTEMYITCHLAHKPQLDGPQVISWVQSGACKPGVDVAAWFGPQR